MPAEASAPRRLAILYGYDGSQFQGLERTMGLRTIEGTLLSSIASFIGQADPAQRVSLSNISRAATTEPGEHASRQVLSLEVAGAGFDAPLPTAADLAPLVPESIRVYEVVVLNTTFSARRTCDSRCYEFLIPTYAFSAPSKDTHYAYPSLTDEQFEEQWPENENLGPPGGLFKTIKRGMSVKRSKSTLNRGKSLNRAKSVNRAGTSVPEPEILMPAHRPEPVPALSVPVSSYHGSGKGQPSVVPVVVEPQEETGLKKLIRTLTRGRASKNRSAPTDRSGGSAPPLIHIGSSSKDTGHAPPQASGSASSYSLEVGHHHHPPSSETRPIDDEADGGILSTLKRSVSRRSYRDPELESLDGKSLTPSVASATEARYHEPVALPEDTEESLTRLRRYRITQDQLKGMKHILSIYNGTHNWHNYIPGAKYDDARCYMRIINIDCSEPEVHGGTEWVRVKVHAKAFAKHQIRKMLAMAIMVIRTNTPRSVVANSFGVTNIDIPEAPETTLVLDEPMYDTFNSDCERRGDPKGIHFAQHANEITSFRHRYIHDAIYRSEVESMKFAAWTRKMDSHSFLYTYFLNPRGVITPQSDFLSKRAVAAEQERIERERRAKADSLFV
ncbi:tRNA pseudouridine synthase 1 [Thoreauomyces humboldtii]|nr:tRNA pseudouridine synthase 1 [Thoreauomyces humboldtii]